MSEEEYYKSENYRALKINELLDEFERITELELSYLDDIIVKTSHKLSEEYFAYVENNIDPPQFDIEYQQSYLLERMKIINLYHNFENALKSYFQHFLGSIDLEHYSIHKLEKALKKFDLNICTITSYREIEQLRILCNKIKHNFTATKQYEFSTAELAIPEIKAQIARNNSSPRLHGHLSLDEDLLSSFTYRIIHHPSSFLSDLINKIEIKRDSTN